MSTDSGGGDALAWRGEAGYDYAVIRIKEALFMSTSVLHQIESLLGHLTRDEQWRVMEELARRLRRTEPRQPQSLHGILKGQIVEDFDLETTLKEIRSRWLEDFPELNS
jgi:hypothetical protein